MGQPVLAQILKYLGKEEVESIALKHQSDRYVKKLSTYNYVSALLFGVMSFCNSIRELVLVLAAEQSKLLHLSIDYKVSRTSFARVNGSKNPKILEDIYCSLLRRFSSFLWDSRLYKASVDKLYALDSTTITLSSTILKGTGKPCYADGRRKGGIKVHAVINVDEGVPHMVKFSKAAKGDVKFMGMAAKLPRGSFITMDKAYSDHKILEKLTLLCIWYVTRLKDNVKYKVLKAHTDFKKAPGWKTARERVLRDETISISLTKKKTHTCRRIEYIGIVKDRNGKEREKLFVFITNNLELDALTVAGIYRNRWQIELMFKRIKQNFPLKYFYGDNVNAIKNQIWAVLIACLLLTILHRKVSESQKWAFSSVVSLVRRLLMSYIDIQAMLNNPKIFPSNMYCNPPPEQDLFSIAERQNRERGAWGVFVRT
jgi:hypothetical protein